MFSKRNGDKKAIAWNDIHSVMIHFSLDASLLSNRVITPRAKSLQGPNQPININQSKTSRGINRSSDLFLLAGLENNKPFGIPR